MVKISVEGSDQDGSSYKYDIICEKEYLQLPKITHRSPYGWYIYGGDFTITGKIIEMTVKVPYLGHIK